MTVTNLTAPTVTGTARVGNTLTASQGTWSFSLDYLTYAYQWERCDAGGASCADIAGATNSTYILQTADVGSTIRVEVTATEHAGATPPPSTDAYFDVDWSSGIFEDPFTLLFSYSSPGWTNLPASQSSDGRVDIVPDPAGGPGNAARLEMRDSDPPWPPITTVQKSEISSDAPHTYNQPQVNVGDIRWFSTPLYLPYTGGEKFEWAHGGSQPYFSLIGLHPASNTGWGAIHLGWEAYQFNSGGDSYQDKNVHLNFRMEGGTFPEQTYSHIYNLLPLTDGAGARVMANHNRWIELVWGMKFAPTAAGWFEVWVDGVNTVPRVSRPTMWAGDTGQYFKYGLYKKKDASFPISGRSVLYWGHTTIGYDRPF